MLARILTRATGWRLPFAVRLRLLLLARQIDRAASHDEARRMDTELLTRRT